MGCLMLATLAGKKIEDDAFILRPEWRVRMLKYRILTSRKGLDPEIVADY